MPNPEARTKIAIRTVADLRGSVIGPPHPPLQHQLTANAVRNRPVTHNLTVIGT